LSLEESVPERRSDPSRTAYQRAIRAFAEVAGALGEVREQDALLHLIAKKITELVGVQRCSVYLKDEETGFFRGQVGHADHDIDARVKRLVAGVAADAFTREILETQAPVVIGDAQRDPRPVRSTMRAWNIRAMMGVPMILSGEVIGLIFLDDENCPHRFDDVERDIASAFAELAAVAIWQAQMTASMRKSVETVARQNDLLRRATAVEDRLSTLVLQGGNLREIAQAVAQLTSKPSAIYDVRYQQLAVARAPGMDQEVMPGLLEPGFRTHRDVVEALAGLGPRGGVVGPIPSAGLHHRYLIVPVSARDDVWGYLVVMEHQTRFGALDAHVSRRAATNIALEMSAERRVINLEWDARSSLAGELLRGPGDETWLHRRADFLGVRLDVPRVLVLVTVRDGDYRTVPDPRRVAEALSEQCGGGEILATAVAEGVAMMMNVRTDVAPAVASRGARETVAAAFRSLDPEGHLLAGLSAICRAPADYAGAYSQASQVLKAMRNFRRAGAETVLSTDDLGAGRLLLATTDRTEAERFAEETLGPLLEDPEGMADLMATLRTFFDTGRSVRRSALELQVHENTVRYRLVKIEELTGLPIATDADAQLSAQLALLVLRLQGRLAERSEPSPASEDSVAAESVGS
jgi:sugar diacid utilization regulator